MLDLRSANLANSERCLLNTVKTTYDLKAFYDFEGVN